MLTTWMLAMMVTLTPYPVAQGGPEYKTVTECTRAIDSIQDPNMKARLVCIAVTRNYI